MDKFARLRRGHGGQAAELKLVHREVCVAGTMRASRLGSGRRGDLATPKAFGVANFLKRWSRDAKLKERSFRQNAETSTLKACAPQNCAITVLAPA
jgi:hypothetical protein